ncbi:MAG: YbjQ family protein [Deltaproteobacteria bacterium]|nr:YbjQ family protein [Deltaproteobacteria bacterium]
MAIRPGASTAPLPHQIPIQTTFDPPPGYEVERVVGPCWGITVRSRSVVGTTCAGCQTIFGGEITMFSELANETRNEAMNRLEQHARQMGANAVLGFRFDSSELMQNTNEIVAYGTAVVIRRTSAAP